MVVGEEVCWRSMDTSRVSGHRKKQRQRKGKGSFSLLVENYVSPVYSCIYCKNLATLLVEEFHEVLKSDFNLHECLGYECWAFVSLQP